jgi:hypothetical protein
MMQFCTDCTPSNTPNLHNLMQRQALQLSHLYMQMPHAQRPNKKYTTVPPLHTPKSAATVVQPVQHVLLKSMPAKMASHLRMVYLAAAAQGMHWHSQLHS